jgi:hypothetical protein
LRTFELAVASVFGLLGFRSLVVWARRPLQSRSLKDHALYALWVTGRVGLWFAIAGVFLISASIDVRGKAFTQEWSRFSWYVAVPLSLAAVQLLAGFLLGRSGD